MKIRSLIENNFVAVVLIGYAIGLFVPAISLVPQWFILFTVAGLIYFACANITINELRCVKIYNAIGFYVVRYTIFPIGVYFLISIIAPPYKEAALLMAFAPAAAASSTWSSLFGGSAALALGYTIISSLLAPFLIPAAVAVFGNSDAQQINSIGMLGTLSAVIFLPIVFYFFFSRPYPKIKNTARKNVEMMTVLLLGLLSMFSIAGQRELIISNPYIMLSAFPIIMIIYVSFFIFGWFFPSHSEKDRISHTITSGLNNAGLMVGISSVFFNQETTLYVITAQIIWTGSIVAAKYFLLPKKKIKH